MAKNKTAPTNVSVVSFTEHFASTEQKKADSHSLIRLMQDISGYEPIMWGPSIIGFGTYYYRYPSGHEGKAPLIGFSPRKAAISLYVFTGLPEHVHLLEGLGKYKTGKACIYIKELADINTDILKKLMHTTILYLQQQYGK